MKRYRMERLNPNVFGGGLREETVIELANDKEPPAGAVEVPESTALHEWRPVTLDTLAARESEES